MRSALRCVDRFALYPPGARAHFLAGVRVGGPFTFQHVPWLWKHGLRPAPPDFEYYLKHRHNHIGMWYNSGERWSRVGQEEQQQEEKKEEVTEPQLAIVAPAMGAFVQGDTVVLQLDGALRDGASICVAAAALLAVNMAKSSRCPSISQMAPLV